MAAFYFDTSGLVKRYVAEAGTPWVRALIGPAARHAIFTSWLTRVELTAALARRE